MRGRFMNEQEVENIIKKQMEEKDVKNREEQEKEERRKKDKEDQKKTKRENNNYSYISSFNVDIYWNNICLLYSK